MTAKKINWTFVKIQFKDYVANHIKIYGSYPGHEQIFVQIFDFFKRTIKKR